MARYTGPTTRLNRRFKQAIFPATKAFEKKPYLPGIHGPRLRRKVSDYSIGLNEKQKTRYMYGLTEKQFRLTFDKAKQMKGITGETFIRLLEMRLDNVVYLAGMARTRNAARQFVNHGHVRVNGIKTDIPSFTCKPGDVIEVCERTASRRLATQSIDDTQYRTNAPWMTVSEEALKVIVDREPIRDEMDQSINEQLIVEFYSR